MSKRRSPTFSSIAFQHGQTVPRKTSPTTTFESLLPETQQKYYQPQRKEKEDAKQEQLYLIKNRKRIQAALNARDKADEEIAHLKASIAERESIRGLKKSTTMSDLTKYNEDKEDPDPNETWRDSERRGGRGTNRHSLGRRRTRTTKKRRTKQKKTKRRKTKSTRKKIRRHRSTRRRR